MGPALGGCETALEGIRGGEPEVGFGSATPDESRDRGEGGGGRTAHDIAVRVVMQGVEEPITGEPAVKEAHAVGGQEREQALRLHALIPVLEGADGTSDRQAAQDIVDRHDQTLRVMPTARRCQATVGIECLPHGHSGRQGVGGPIEGEDRQAVPLILLARRKDLVCQRDQTAEQEVEDLPGELGPCFGERAAVGAVRCGPQATATRQSKERLEFGRDPCVASTGDKGDEHDDQMAQRKLTATGEVLDAGHGERLYKV